MPSLCSAETCTGQDLADLGDRLRDWFQLLHENSKQNGSASSAASPASGRKLAAPPGGGREIGKVLRTLVYAEPAHPCSFLLDSGSYSLGPKRTFNPKRSTSTRAGGILVS